MFNRKGKVLIPALIATVLIVAAGFAGSLALAKPAEMIPANGNTYSISVSGNAQVSLKPDVAYVTLGALTYDASAAIARNTNNELMTKVMAAVKAQGVAAEDIKTVNYSVSPRYDQNSTKIIGYEINNSIQVKVKNIDKLGLVIQDGTAAGANMANGLYFDVQDREGAYNQALTKAIENARMRAETLAKSAGGQLGAVLNVSENGGYNPWPIYRGGFYDKSGSGNGAPVSSGNMDISAAVSITFELK